MKPAQKPAAVREASCAAVWGPWLAAPLFALLPIAGCGLAGGLRTAVAHPPGPTATAAPAAPVVPILTAPIRQVASGSIAH